MEKNVNLLEIPTETSYWLVRATGGKFFDDFLENEFISIAHNEVKISDFPKYDDFDNSTLISLKHTKEIYSDKYPDTHPSSLTTIAKQAYNFMYGMKINDVVITPNKHSEKFAIGVIQSEPFDESQETIDKKIKNAIPNGRNYPIDINIKRRKIQWVKIVSRKEIPKELFWLYSAHQTIFNLSEFSKYFDRLLSPIYIKDEKITINIRVESGQDLTAQQFLDFNSLLRETTGTDLNKIKMETDVHSPGFITLIIDANNSDSLSNIIKFLWNVSSDQNNASYAISSLTIIKLVFGDDVFKTGIVGWFKKASKHKEDSEIKALDKQSKEKDIESKEKDIELKNKEIELKDTELKIKQFELKKAQLSTIKESIDESSTANIDDSSITNVINMDLHIRDEGDFISHNYEQNDESKYIAE